MYLGRFRLGDSVIVTTRVWPGPVSQSLFNRKDANPKIKVWNGATGDVILASQRMAAFDYERLPGLFRGEIRLLEQFPSQGPINVRVAWPTPNVNLYLAYAVYTFEIIPTGNTNGTNTSMVELVRPEARFIVTGTNQGRILRRKNARVPQ